VETCERVSLVGGTGTVRHSASATVAHTHSALLLLSQDRFSLEPMSRLSLYSLDQGEPLLEIPWPGEQLQLMGVSLGRALLQTNTHIYFFSLSAGEVIQSWAQHTLSKESGLPPPTGLEPGDSVTPYTTERWTAVMDCDPRVAEFALYTPTLSAWRLFRFQEREMGAASPILTGSHLAEAVEGLGPNVRLLRGCLIANRAKELPTSGLGSAERATGCGGLLEDTRLQCHEVSAYNLSSSCRHNLVSMAKDRGAASKTDLLLNQASLRWEDSPKAGPGPATTEHNRHLWNPDRRPLAIVSASRLGILLESGNILRTVDFSLTAQEVAQREAAWLMDQEKGLTVAMEE